MPVTVTETLRELNGVGVSLNYMKEEGFDQWGLVIGGFELEGAGAGSIIQAQFDTTYIPGNGVLSRTYSWWPTSTPRRWVYTYGGIEDNGYTVRASAEMSFGPW